MSRQHEKSEKMMSSQTQIEMDLTQDEVDEEIRLSEHNRRFQAVVLKHLDDKLEQAQFEIDARGHELTLKQCSREDLALELKEAKAKVKFLQNSLTHTRGLLQTSDEDKQIAEVCFKQCKTELCNEKTDNEMLRKDIVDKQILYEQELNKNRKMHELQNVVSADVRMRTIMHRMLEEEVERLNTEKSDAIRDLNQWQIKFKESMVAVRDVSSDLCAHKHESKLSKITLARVLDEMELLVNSKNVLLRRWDEAVKAMAERDQHTRMITKENKEAQQTNETLKIQSNSFMEDATQARKRTAQFEQRMFHSIRKHDILQHNLADSNEKKRCVEHRLECTGLAYHQVLAGLNITQEQVQQLKANIFSITQAMERSNATISQQKHKFNVAEEEHSRCVLALKRQIHTLTSSYAIDSRKWKTNISELEVLLKQSRTICIELEIEVTKLQNERGILANQVVRTVQTADDASNRADLLQQEVVRAEYQALKSDELARKLRKVAYDVDPYVNKIKGLEKALSMSIDEHKRLRKAYARAQDQLLQANKRIHVSKEETKDASTRILLADSMCDRATTGLKMNEIQTRADAIEHDNTRFNMKQYAVKLNEQGAANKDLQRDVVNLRILHDTNMMKSKAELDALKQEVIALRRTKNELRKEIECERKHRFIAESVVRTLRKSVAKSDKKLSDNAVKVLSQRNTIRALKIDRVADSKNFMAWAKTYDLSRFANAAANSVRTANTRVAHVKIESARMPSIKRASEYNGKRGLKNRRDDETRETSQLKGELLRTQTHFNERLAEIVQLKRHVESLENANQEILLEQHDATKSLDSVTKKKQTLEANLRVMTDRCRRAESMAATLEAQLFHQNIAIDYEFKEREPTKQLMNVIHIDTNQKSYETEPNLDEKSLDNFLQSIKFDT